MIDSRLETLKWGLVSRGYEDDEILRILQSAREEIILGIDDLVSSCLQEIQNTANDIDSEEFLSEIRLVSNNGYLEIETDSGKTDFSKPEMRMLPSILSNGKTSSSGTTYKVVPIGKNPFKEQRQTMIKNVDAGINAISSLSKDKISVQDATAEMAVAFGMAANSKIAASRQSPSVGGAVQFRTASSNQDETKDWVIPEKKADMTNIINEINTRIRYKTDDIINDVIRRYEREY
jgi:hypothetical protein